MSEFTGFRPLINVFNIFVGPCSHSRSVGLIKKNWTQKLCCFAVLYVNIVHVFVGANSSSFKEYLTVHVQFSVPSAFLNDDIDKHFIHFFCRYSP